MLTGTSTHGKAVGQVNTSIAVISKLITARGRRNFQASAISWSILTLGKVVRVQTMTKNTAKTLIISQSHGGSNGPRQPERKRVAIMVDMTSASPYSAK